MKLKSGQRFGKWKLVGEKEIGQGGNSVVWRANTESGDLAAIKLLTRFDRYERFRDEVQFQKAQSSNSGILPLLDAHLPETPSKTDRPWLVTPLVKPVHEQVETSGNKLITAVRMVHDVAVTLAAVHADSSAHRDIKPENLFIYDGRAVLADFGLVSYIGKESVTMTGERLGPIHYVAPELIGNLDEPDDCRPGDVYALAKTLWVLASGQRFPLPGHHSAAETAYQLSQYVNHERTVLLDKLLDIATAVNPTRRPLCVEFASELDAWLNEGETPTGLLSIPTYATARLTQLTESAESARRERQQARYEIDGVMSRVHETLVQMGKEIATAANTSSRSQSLPDGNTNGALRYFRYRRQTDTFAGANRTFEEFFETVHGKTIIACGCAVLDSIESDVGFLRGGLVIAASHRQTDYVLQREFRFRFGSALQESAVNQFLSDMQEHLPAFVGCLIQVLTEENLASDPAGCRS